MGGRRKDGSLPPGVAGDEERVLERWHRRPEPISLSPAEVRASGRPHEGDGTRVRVLMPHLVSYTEHIELEGVVEGWTRRAVRVRATHPDGRSVTAWVWAGAVKRIDPEQTGRKKSPQQGSNLRPTD